MQGIPSTLLFLHSNTLVISIMLGLRTRFHPNGAVEVKSRLDTVTVKLGRYGGK